MSEFIRFSQTEEQVDAGVETLESRGYEP